MDIINIQYIFKFDDHRSEIIDLQLDPKTLELVKRSEGELPFWTVLDFNQCPHCQVDPEKFPHCPVAAALVDVVRRFEHVFSYDEVDLEVTLSSRHVIQRTTAQRGISSLLGVLFPASGCPHTAFFKPMLRFHLPLATEEDTVFRAGGMFLMAQYFLKRNGLGGELNFSGLSHIYENMNLLNMNIAERVRNATLSDSSVNAITLLDVFTHTLPLAVEDQLEEMRYLFAPYLSRLPETPSTKSCPTETG